MLNADLVNDLIAPVTADEPCGPDLEYDAAFMALIVASQGKAEQQFGDTIIAAVEPDWAQVEQQATDLLRRSKDLRCATLLLRAATRTQGLEGARLGIELLAELLERYWDGLHPMLDADDGNDPTMRLNALAVLNDENAFIHDLYDATLGIAAGIGPIRVRDIAMARGTLAASGDGSQLSPAAIQGGLDDIVTSAPGVAQCMHALGALIQRLSNSVIDRGGAAQALDLTRLSSIARLLHQAAPSADDTSRDQSTAPEDLAAANQLAPPASSASRPGDIHTRQDALQALDRVIRFLEQTEPGNPAPLLIARAKQLIGVSFLDIMANLAPSSLETIQVITGPRPES